MKDSPPIAGWTPLAITLTMQTIGSAIVLAPTVVAPELLAALDLPIAAVGVYVALLSLFAIVSTVTAGHLVRAWGAIRTSQVGLALGALGLGLICTGQLPLAMLGAAAIGLGYGPITPASSQILFRLTPAHRLNLVFSIKQTGVPLGGAITGLVAPPLTLLGGWPLALAALALAALACAAYTMRLRAALDVDRDPSARLPNFAALLLPIRLVARDPGLKALALCSALLSAVQICLTSYLVTFLTAQLEWSLIAAGVALTVSQTAAVGGRILWGWLADGRFGARTTLMMLCTMMIASCLSMTLIDAGTPQYLVLAMVGIYGASALGWNGIYLAAVARIAPPGQAGFATSGTLAYTYLGVALGLPGFGVLAAAIGSFGIAYAVLGVPLAACLYLLQRVPD
ncbi:MAG: MFS transporter [Burkholderiaceae bacterium]|nr:MFS transporter [Burkholderiaceae bacterium]